MSLRCSFLASNHHELAHLELLLLALITPLLLQPDDADDADADDADADADDDADDANGNNYDDDDLLFQPDSLLHLSKPLLQLLHLKIRLLLICTSLKIENPNAKFSAALLFISVQVLTTEHKHHHQNPAWLTFL